MLVLFITFLRFLTSRCARMNEAINSNLLICKKIYCTSASRRQHQSLASPPKVYLQMRSNEVILLVIATILSGFLSAANAQGAIEPILSEPSSKLLNDTSANESSMTYSDNSTQSEEMRCMDSPLKIVLPWNKKVRSVNWVNRKPIAKESRCHRGNVESQYPLSCNICDKYACKDSRRKFILKKNKRKKTW